MSGPAARIVAAAEQERTVTDSLGRVIKWRRLGALDRARLFKAVGAAQSSNAPYVGMAMLAASATTVDGTPLPFPTHDAIVEKCIAILGDEGIEAVAAGLVAENEAAESVAAAAQEALTRTAEGKADAPAVVAAAPAA